MNLQQISIHKPDDVNFILAQSHFIMTVEDVHSAIVAAVPGIKFGLAFCEASGPSLIRWSGTDDAMIALARENASRIAAGHSLLVFLAPGYFPINVLPTVRNLPEIAQIFCATANPATVILADLEGSRGILGVADGNNPKGIEGPADQEARRSFLRKIGYKA